MPKKGGIPLAVEFGKYLSVCIIQGRLTNTAFQPLVERVRSCLHKWKTNTLILERRVTLARFVLTTILLHTMHTYLVRIGGCDQIDKVVQQFVWKGAEAKKCVHLVYWQTICLPRAQGGLSLRVYTITTWHSLESCLEILK